MRSILDVIVCFVAAYLVLLAIVLAACSSLKLAPSTDLTLMCVCLAGLFSLVFGKHFFD